MKHCALMVAAVCAAGSFVGAARADFQNHVIALSDVTGQYGPGFSIFGDDTFGQFTKATINNAGDVAFGSSNSAFSPFLYTPSGENIIRYVPGSGLELVARSAGSSAPFTSVDNPFLAGDGSVAFRGSESGGNTAFFHAGLGSTPINVAEVGGTSSGQSPVADTTYQTLSSYGQTVYGGGHLAFGATLSGTGVTSSNANVLVRSDDGALGTLLARQGAQGSDPYGTDNGVRTWGTNFTPMGVNSRGDTVFLSGYTGGSFGEPSMFGKIDGVTGEVTTVAVSGTPVAGSTGNYTFIQGSGRIDINDAGDMAFMGRSGSSQPNVVSKVVGGTTSYLARAGEVIDGHAITGFSSTRDPVISGNSSVFYFANTDNSGHFGVFKNTGSTTQFLFGTGDVAVGPGNGLWFVDINQFAVNSQDEFTFYAQLAGTGVTSANDMALFAYRGGVLEMVAREGEQFDIDPTAGVDLHTIYSIVTDTQLINTGGQDGRRSNINDDGTVVMSLLFRDTANGPISAGVFINPPPAVPEPASLGLLGAGLMALMRRRW